MTKEQIIKIYTKYVIKNKSYPSRDDLLAFGDVSRDMVRSKFGNYDKLKAHVMELGVVQDHILDVEHLNYEHVKETNKDLVKYKRFVITTAVTNSMLNEEFFASLKGYCKHEKAALVVLPSLMKGSGAKWTLDVELKDENIVFYDYHFNSNIGVLGMLNNSKSSDPITGLPRLGKRNGSFICASPKQNLKVVATGINKLPHAIMSTGAVTYPEYITKGPMRAKQDYMAENDHTMGAVIVELDINETFHYRQIQCDKNNGFADLGSYYKGKKKLAYAPRALVMGDWHSGDTDPTVASAWFNLVSNTSVKELFVHDGFNGLCVNPYVKDKTILRGKMSRHNKLSLDQELSDYTADLKGMLSEVKKVVVVKSNHDDWLDQYLEKCLYKDEPYNQEVALELALAKFQGADPLEYYVRKNGIKSDNLVYLKRDESYKIAGIELGMHGDKGANGAGGSAKTMEEAYGDCVYGHTHTPNILRSAYCVGTSTPLEVGYNVGASSWFNTSCLVYDNGNRQLINVIDGRYTTKKL